MSASGRRSKKTKPKVQESPNRSNMDNCAEESEVQVSDSANQIPNDSPCSSSSSSGMMYHPDPDSPGLRSKVEATQIDLSNLFLTNSAPAPAPGAKEESTELLDITKPFLEATKGEWDLIWVFV